MTDWLQPNPFEDNPRARRPKKSGEQRFNDDRGRSFILVPADTRSEYEQMRGKEHILVRPTRRTTDDAWIVFSAMSRSPLGVLKFWEYDSNWCFQGYKHGTHVKPNGEGELRPMLRQCSSTAAEALGAA